MKLVVAVLGLLFAGASPALAADGPQPLSITVSDTGARAVSLAAYDPNLPVAVTIDDRSTRRGSRMTVIAAGPAGESIRVQLVPGAGGSTTGTLKLPHEGRWRVELASDSGALRNETTPIAIDVAAPPPSNSVIVGLAVGTAIFIVAGGGGFLLLRQALRQPPVARELDKAA